LCGYGCGVVGGPWIADNPDCPVCNVEEEPSAWIEGEPVLDKETHKDRAVWLRMYDQGGCPFVVMAHLRMVSKDPAEAEAFHLAWLEWLRGGQKGPRPKEQEYILTVSIPSLYRGHKPLSDVWNITHYQEAPKPSEEV
jgi:hypothetical protein